MNILSWLRPKPQQPAPQPVAPSAPALVKHNFVVEKGQAGVAQAESLDAFYAADAYLDSAQDILKTTAQAELLRSQDGQVADFDSRQGHVVLHQEKSEFHPTESGFEANLKGRLVKAEGERVTVDGFDTRSYESIQGVWDRQARTVTLEVPLKEADYSSESSLAGADNFEIDAQGRIALPSASSLAEADQVAAQRGRAERAQEILESAVLWHETAKSFDGKANDLNSAEGISVVTNVDRGKLEKALAGESVMGGGHYQSDDYADNDHVFDGFDLQGSATEFIVAGATPGSGDSQVRFSGTFSGDQVNIVYSNRPGNEEERVTWSKSDGSVRYQNSYVH